MRPKKYNKGNGRKKSLNCTVEEWIYEEIENLAKQKDIGRSEVLNKCLTSYFKKTIAVA
jgi:hypothetical protein